MLVTSVSSPTLHLYLFLRRTGGNYNRPTFPPYFWAMTSSPKPIASTTRFNAKSSCHIKSKFLNNNLETLEVLLNTSSTSSLLFLTLKERRTSLHLPHCQLLNWPTIRLLNCSTIQPLFHTTIWSLFQTTMVIQMRIPMLPNHLLHHHWRPGIPLV